MTKITIDYNINEINFRDCDISSINFNNYGELIICLKLTDKEDKMHYVSFGKLIASANLDKYENIILIKFQTNNQLQDFLKRSYLKDNKYDIKEILVNGLYEKE